MAYIWVYIENEKINVDIRTEMDGGGSITTINCTPPQEINIVYGDITDIPKDVTVTVGNGGMTIGTGVQFITEVSLVGEVCDDVYGIQSEKQNTLYAKYDAEFIDKLDNRWELFIRRKGGYYGSHKTLTLSENPITIKRSVDDEDDLLSPIYKSSVQINAIIDYDDIEEVKKNLFVGAYEVLVEIFKNGEIFWRGWMLPNHLEYMIKGGKIPLSIRASDGLGLLDYVDIENDIYKMVNGIDSFVDFDDLIGFVLKSIMLGTEPIDNLSQDVNILYQSSLKYDGDDLIDIAKINVEQFWDGTFDPKQFLEKICRSFGWRIFLSPMYLSGDWEYCAFIQRIQDNISDSNNIRWFSYLGSMIDLIDVDIDNVEIGTEENPFVNDFSLVKVVQSYSKVNIDTDYEYSNLVENANFQDGFDKWNYNSSTVSLIGSGTIDDPYEVRMDGENSTISNKNYIITDRFGNIHLSFDIRIPVGDGMGWYIAATTNNETNTRYWDQNNNEWEQGTLGLIPIVNHVDKQADEGFDVINVDVIMPFPPVTDPPGSFTVRKNLQIRFVSNENTIAILSNIRLTQEPLRNTGIIHIVKNKFLIADTKYDDNVLLTQSVNMSNSIYPHLNREKYWSSDDVIVINSFDNDPFLDELMVKSKAILYSYNKDNISCQVLTSEVLPYQNLKYKNLNYIQMYDEYDIRSGVHNLKILSIEDKKYDPSLFEIQSINKGDSNFSRKNLVI